ncbi:protein kinase [bacterium]|nr:protein kinase [bacterium]
MSLPDNEREKGQKLSSEAEALSQVLALPAEQYRVKAMLGKGAFAETYLAEDKHGQRQVAVKVFHPPLVDTWKSYELFEREVAILKALDHPGIPEIYDYFEVSEPSRSAYLIMEYLEGETLAGMIERKQTLDPQTSIDVFTRLLDIVEYLHGRTPPVLHRDIKPANIIIRKTGMPALIDFGSVRVVFQKPDEKSSTIIGTHGYMPYEQYLGQASPSSDLYALAATFLEVLTGRPPAEFLSSKGVIEVPDGLTCGPHFAGILKKMLAHAMDQRFQSVAEVRRALYAPLLKPTEAVSLTALPAETALTIPAGPRAIEGQLETFYEQCVGSFGKYMTIGTDGNFPPEMGPGQWTVIAISSIMTAGILPLVEWKSYKKLKRNVTRFFTQGTLALGRVQKTVSGRSNYSGARVYHVLYSFEVEGREIRASGDLRPKMAQFWKEGTPVYVLYMPEDPAQSIIIGEVTDQH